MFKSARLKLTAWYLLIIMGITISFSSFVYIRISIDTKRALEGQKRRVERQLNIKQYSLEFPPMGPGPMIDEETLIEIRNQTLINLVIINIVIFISSGLLGYVLAGRTLNPIEEMVKKQKRFISDAAHELKTPLTAMKTSLEVALREKNLSPTESKKLLKETIEDVDRLNKFTQKLLRQSRFQNGNKTDHKKIDLGRLIENVVDKITPIANERKIRINKKLENAQVMGDRDELDELFTNLIDNAIKYSNKKSQVNITLSTKDSFAVVTVEDFGMGIDKKDMKNIFEPFYRSDKSRAYSKNGSYGLGLAISKEITHRHKGKISVESVFGSGSRFSVKLPISSQ